MSQQGNINAGNAGKRTGMARAYRHADPAWLAAAHKAVIEAARALPKLTTDDVWSRIGPSYATHENRALGPIMRAAAKDAIIVKAVKEEPVKCVTRPSNHRRPLQVWLSLIYKGIAHETIRLELEQAEKLASLP